MPCSANHRCCLSVFFHDQYGLQEILCLVGVHSSQWMYAITKVFLVMDSFISRLWLQMCVTSVCVRCFFHFQPIGGCLCYQWLALQAYQWMALYVGDEGYNGFDVLCSWA